MTNFQRSYSRVWWANDNNEFGSMSMLPHQKFNCEPQKFGHLNDIAEESSPNRLSHIRRSVRSHDSGFNDSDHSPNTTSNSSQISAHNNSDSSGSNDENQNCQSPERTGNNVSIVCVSGDQSPSIANETLKTPPTVIRRKHSLVVTPTARRISFSEPSSPDVVESSKLNNSFRSLESFAMKASKKQNTENERINKSLNNSRARNSSLRRGKTISPANNSSYRKRANRRRLLDCVSQVSNSTDDVYTLASDTSMEKDTSNENPENYHHYESLSEVNAERAELEYSEIETEYNNETVTFGSAIETSHSNERENDQMNETKEKLMMLPTYDELYPTYVPYMCSTPKFESKSKKNTSQTSDHTESSITAINGASQYEIHPIEQQQSQQQMPNFFDSDIDLSLPITLDWETCTYMEYTNSMLNGHAYSVQYWIDETRATYCHEIMSTLQTKSILHEAARSLKLNPPIAAKLIYQIQLKVIAIETKFDEIERIFEMHAKLVKCLRKTQANNDNDNNNNNNNIDDSIEIADNKFKEKLSVLMKTLTGNVCQFTSKLNSKIIFQKVSGCAETGADLKHFERNVRNVIDLCQDLGVACTTKIDDIEPNVLLKDFYTLKQTVLKMIRKIFRRLVNIIVMRIEENPHDMLLRANINTIATLPTESVYNSTERFSSLNDAFIASGIIRVLLMICLDSDKISVRALSLRALTTICSSAEMIRQFIEIGGLDVVTDILTDDKRKDVKFEPELREAVSVLTQVTAPWHHGDSGNIDDLLKLSIDNLVTRLTVLIHDTECLETLMLSAACLNNISRKSSLAFYSLMDNRSIHQLIQACDIFQQRSQFKYSAIFIYVSIYLIPWGQTNVYFHYCNHFAFHIVSIFE